MKFIERIKQLREERRMPQRQFAAQTGRETYHAEGIIPDENFDADKMM